MPDPPKPRGKVPEGPSRKPFVAPGLSSWANPTEQVSNTKKTQDAQAQDGKPTNRSKYENKPMPATPTASPSSSANPKSNTRYPIQPATPFVRSSRNRQDTKNRAVTEPIMPQPLFTTQQKSKPQHGENAADIKGESTHHQPSSPPSPVNDEASEIQGVHPVAHDGVKPIKEQHLSPPPTSTSEALEFQGFRRPVADNRVRDELPASAPPTYGASSAYGSPPGNRSAGPRSTPLPTRRYHQEKDLPSPPLAHESFPSSPQMGSMGRDEMQVPNHPEGIIMGDGVLNPTRTGTYARVGEVGFVEQDPQRVVSQVVQYGGIEYPGTSDARGHPGSTGSQRPTYRGSTQYAPSTYAGVWENNPHVGRSLPPYGSDVHQFPPNAGYPVIFDRYGRPINRPVSYQSSSHSYAPVSRGNSYASTNAPSTTRFSNQSSRFVERNAAPTPPRSYPGFQPSGPMSAELTQLEMNLHHHIDNRSDSLTRLMTDKLDRLGDHMAMRFDSLEETVGKGLGKSLKNDLKEIKKDSAARHREFQDIAKNIDSITELLRAKDLKLDTLKKKIDEAACKCLPQDAEPNGSEVGRRSPPRRTESADAYLGRGEQHIQPPASQPSPGGRQSSPGGRQSSTGGHQSSGARRQLNDMVLTVPTDPNASRQFFIELGSMTGPPPDLSQHPAYRGAQQGTSPSVSQDPMAVAVGFMNNEDTAYQVPNFRRDWYKHAFQK